MSTPSLSPILDAEFLSRKSSRERPVAHSFSFEQGWRNLPEEVRLAVFTIVFTYDCIIDRAEYDKILDSIYYPLLLTPYAGIATEALYAHNSFDISIASRRYPPPAHNTWIRRLRILMKPGDGTTGWPFLDKLCTGALGFERLREITITLTSVLNKNHFRHAGYIGLFDFGLPSNLVLVQSSVKKLSLVRTFTFEEPLLCSVFLRYSPPGTMSTRPWDRFRLAGDCSEELPMRCGFFDHLRKLYGYDRLPFEEVTNMFNGVRGKKGIIAGFLALWTQTLKHTSSTPREQSHGLQEEERSKGSNCQVEIFPM
jgi:hypothetical protein